LSGGQDEKFERAYRNPKKLVLTHNKEYQGEHAETQKLNGLSAPSVDQSECNPKARDEAAQCDHDISSADVSNVLVDTK
jgi:hypothetical protein